MFRRLLTAVLILPGTVVVLVPTLIVFLTAGTAFGARPAGPRDFQLWLGLILLGAGLCGAIWTSRLFVTVGRGTPAPWDPPKTLVVRGPFARDELMAWCEANGVDYVFGLARNDRLVRTIAHDLAAAALASRAHGGSCPPARSTAAASGA